ncbi:hypothetical protein HOY80DRAFT_1045750 [Tuber brumale]|nr:hypothetical protein HOY80DRAFT_1045750 [Tuber brumale]
MKNRHKYFTQNIGTLEHAAGVPPERPVEARRSPWLVHGTTCVNCPTSDLADRMKECVLTRIVPPREASASIWYSQGLLTSTTHNSVVAPVTLALCENNTLPRPTLPSWPPTFLIAKLSTHSKTAFRCAMPEPPRSLVFIVCSRAMENSICAYDNFMDPLSGDIEADANRRR